MKQFAVYNDAFSAVSRFVITPFTASVAMVFIAQIGKIYPAIHATRRYQRISHHWDFSLSFYRRTESSAIRVITSFSKL